MPPWESFAGRLRFPPGGRLLADRSLSRLLGRDWPRSLDELDDLTASRRPPDLRGA